MYADPLDTLNAESNGYISIMHSVTEEDAKNQYNWIAFVQSLAVVASTRIYSGVSFQELSSLEVGNEVEYKNKVFAYEGLCVFPSLSEDANTIVFPIGWQSTDKSDSFPESCYGPQKWYVFSISSSTTARLTGIFTWSSDAYGQESSNCLTLLGCARASATHAGMCTPSLYAQIPSSSETLCLTTK